LTSNDLLGIHPALPAGSYKLNDSIIDGSFLVTRGGGLSQVKLSWSDLGTGLLLINGGTQLVTINAATESSADPIVETSVLVVGGLPEPGSLVAGFTLLAPLVRSRARRR
jgi:hypothetical protein